MLSFRPGQSCDIQCRKVNVVKVSATHTHTLAGFCFDGFCFDGFCFRFAFNIRTAGANNKIACRTVLCSDEESFLIHHYVLGHSASCILNHKMLCSDNGATRHDHRLYTLSSCACSAKAHLCNTLVKLAVCICIFIARRIPSAVVCLVQQPSHARL